VTTSFNALIYNDKIFFPSKKRLSQEEEPTTLQKLWSYVSGNSEADENF